MLSEVTLIEMVREIQPLDCRLGIYNCIYNTRYLFKLWSMLITAIEIW